MIKPLIALVTLLAAAPLVAQPPLPPPTPGPDTPITEMLPIPAGEFLMGNDDTDELPVRGVKVSAFLMDKHEVTNAQYTAFCTATETKLPVFWGLERFRCGPKFPDHPVIGVSQGNAKKYAEWVGKRLPTEAEWEHAARGGLEGLRYDNSDEITPDDANTKAAKQDGPVAVMSYRPNGYGLHDVVGNVREWVSDRWGGPAPAVPESEWPVADPTGPESGRWRVIKGGGWYSGTSCNTVTRRNILPGSWSDYNVGFRCAKDVD